VPKCSAIRGHLAASGWRGSTQASGHRQGGAHGRPSIIWGAMPSQGPGTLGSRLALQTPECIAGSVKADYLSVGIRVGNRRVGITAHEARSPR
jgi:hypothetical protein